MITTQSSALKEVAAGKMKSDIKVIPLDVYI